MREPSENSEIRNGNCALSAHTAVLRGRFFALGGGHGDFQHLLRHDPGCTNHRVDSASHQGVSP